ncbi:hypothetical protein RUM8411_01783 [Ruegeria meonggei]|uniref:Uncharacterized protein n=1 Tax=Ruegeria meonggei TaxID=1446476 RepID=A0A1X6Z4F5_9RHOB|nr:hypothetical protein RUM8411_01783 [Ruegeria meonggei]
MFSLLTSPGLRSVAERELVPFAVSLVVAQTYFKWGSFSLELVGFLALWFVLGITADRILKMLNR